MNKEQASANRSINTWRNLAAATVALMSFVLGLALSRILYEGFFPRALWLGRPLAGLFIGLIGAIFGWLLWRSLNRKLGESASTPVKDDEPYSLSVDHAAWTTAAVFFPLALNLLYLFDRSVNLTTIRFVLFSSLWLVVIFLARQLVRPAIGGDG